MGDGSPPRRPTIYDLATLAKTSPSAVSSVMNGSWRKRRISEALAERITRIAEEQGYAVNAQASLLRRERSNIVGMVVPKYDNRYFGAIAEQFEEIARARSLFPVITCTQRDPQLEIDAAKELLSYQVDCLVATGATDPDRITALCQAAGVRSINLDLPGTLAPSVISDNYAAATDLTRLLLTRCARDFGPTDVGLCFVGGRLSDHNTTRRLEAFRDAVAESGPPSRPIEVLAGGYSAARARRALGAMTVDRPLGLFVNSTITLEGVVGWIESLGAPVRANIRYVVFDWDPFAAHLPGNVGMIQQDVPAMLERAFDIMASAEPPAEQTLIPCILRTAD